MGKYHSGRKINAVWAVIALSTSLALPAFAAESQPPAWAYPVNPPGFTGRQETGVPQSVPGSTASYTITQLRDRFTAPVWHPEDHPPLPPIVAEGRQPNIWACGVCHRADGPGGPENSSLAGLPAAYIIQQVNEFKSGARKTSVPGRNVDLMIALVKDLTDEELASAAAYFSALKPRQNIEVRETDTVPTTRVAGNFYASNEDGAMEPIAGRIIEVPEDLEQFENRDTHSRFIAYVPTGSVARGESLAKTGNNGKTIPCATCHGPDLHGLGGTPSIAGRSPSYLMRQLYDIKHGARAGAQTPLMAAVVANLGEDEMRDLVAYLATLTP